jgi:peptidoglycan/xylan/chitin deacetylase (PgdA/CDA1 family)/GT2 family glycosyltransferase
VLTVLIATYNGSSTLGRCLDAYCRMDPPAGGWKLIIVDNGSTDSTGVTARSFADRLPLQVICEPERGKNAALNTALSHISGDLVVFTDDDMIPQRDWLSVMRDAADLRPSYSLFGGKILLRWDTPPEKWILDWVPLDITYSATRTVCREGEIAAHAVFGGNMAVRASVFEAGFRFDPSIGPRDGDYVMGSETEFCLRLEQTGLKAWYVERSVVEHIVRDFQCTPDWILRRAARFGRRAYRLDRDAKSADSPYLGVPLGLLGYTLRQAYRSAAARLRGRHKEGFQARWNLHYTIGRIRESRASMCERHARSFHIVMYHRVRDAADPYDFFGLPIERFEKQLAILSRDFAVLPLTEILECIERSRPLPARAVALTFDDGYRDLYTRGAAVLERYRLPALVFAAVDAMDRGFLWPDLLRYAIGNTNASHLELETLAGIHPAAFPLASLHDRLRSLRAINSCLKRISNLQRKLALSELSEKLLGRPIDSVRIPDLMLSWSELRDLARRGIEVGAHTLTHPILTQASPDDCAREVLQSRERLRAETGCTVEHFAYPNGQSGDFSPEVRAIVQAAGFRSASTSIAGINCSATDRFALHRLDGNQAVQELTARLRSTSRRIESGA